MERGLSVRIVPQVYVHVPEAGDQIFVVPVNYLSVLGRLYLRRRSDNSYPVTRNKHRHVRLHCIVGAVDDCDVLDQDRTRGNLVGKQTGRTEENRHRAA